MAIAFLEHIFYCISKRPEMARDGSSIYLIRSEDVFNPSSEVNCLAVRSDLYVWIILDGIIYRHNTMPGVRDEINIIDIATVRDWGRIDKYYYQYVDTGWSSEIDTNIIEAMHEYVESVIQ